MSPEEWKEYITVGLEKSGYSKFWFMNGGSVNFIRSIKDLRSMCSSLSKAAWEQAFEAGVKYAQESKEKND